MSCHFSLKSDAQRFPIPLLNAQGFDLGRMVPIVPPSTRRNSKGQKKRGPGRINVVRAETQAGVTHLRIRICISSAGFARLNRVELNKALPRIPAYVDGIHVTVPQVKEVVDVVLACRTDRSEASPATLGVRWGERPCESAGEDEHRHGGWY
jgi:hypothetical protein